VEIGTREPVSHCVPSEVEMAKRNKSDSRIEQDRRSIIRNRTRRLMYLELGRDNGAIMLNLSEDGCGFEAISSVKLGKTRFSFQTSDGQSIGGDAEIRWIDEPGIMGGLRFLELQAEARNKIRMYLNDAKAPKEPEELSPKKTRRHTLSDVSEREMEQLEIPLSCAYLPTAAPLTLEEVWARFPSLGEGLFDGTSRARARSLSRRIAVFTMAVVSGAVLYQHQPEVTSKLISLGETIAGRSKVPAVLPEGKFSESVNSQLKVNGALAKAETETAPNGEPEMIPSEEPNLARPNPSTGNAERSGPEQEERTVWHRVGTHKLSTRVKEIYKGQPPPNKGESVASLWEGVKGGSISAEISLADRFSRGRGVAKNCEQARILLRAASNKGSREARLRLYQLQSGGCQ
jgi:hypothetical protein